MTLEEAEKEIMQEFGHFDDWMDKYQYIIELGNTLPEIDPQYKTDAYLISGCQSQVWLHAAYDNGQVIFTADSDAIITKGIVNLLVRVLSHRSPDEIIAAKLEYIDAIGLSEHLTAIRSNGLLSMIKQMKLYALVFKTKYGG
jgi:cysteine desulfuration protein SufE